MSNPDKSFDIEQAPPRCFQVLSADEYAVKVAEVREDRTNLARSATPLSILADAQGHTGYPAFQLESRLNLDAFSKLRQLYARSGISETSLWDFLRTRHSDLGGTTGVDFLLGYFDPAVAAMHYKARIDHLLDLAEEDISRISQ